jgi:hypothetical protein
MSLSDTAIRCAKAKPKPYKMFDSGGLFFCWSLPMAANGGVSITVSTTRKNFFPLASIPIGTLAGKPDHKIMTCINAKTKKIDTYLLPSVSDVELEDGSFLVLAELLLQHDHGFAIEGHMWITRRALAWSGCTHAPSGVQGQPDPSA